MLRCTNCNTEVDAEPGARCPNCLRRSSVVDSAAPPRAIAPPPGETLAKAWPKGTTCPLCRERDVSAATFVFSIAKSKIAMIPGQNEHRWVHVRCRSCDGCRARVERLESLRKIGIACLVAFGLAMLALSQLAAGVAVVAVVLGSAVAVATSLIVVFAANSALRRNLEGTPVFEKAIARVSPPGGLVTQERWTVHADVPARSAIIDAAELV